MFRGKLRKAAMGEFVSNLFVLSAILALCSNTAVAQNNFAGWKNYDYTPGDTVIFYDDFSADQVGEFPEMWDQISGECKIVEANDFSWLVASEDSEVDPYLETSLPPAFSVEFTASILRNGKPGHWVVTFLDAAKKQEAEFSFDARAANFMTLSGAASSFEQSVEGEQRIAIMFQDGRFKCYIGKQRVIDATTAGFKPASVRVGLFASEETEEKQPMFSDFRITAKRGTPQELLYDQKRWVCYGIYFDFGAATIRGESFTTLHELGELMKKDPRLNIRIEDHTNDQESDADNMRLSQDRAEAVKDYLMKTFNLAKDRLQTKGWGSSMPIGSTETPDGWEMNRRVELIKI
jgi:outer membrane protein OmpA-like peptidoglycan-associated protein